ERQEAHDQHDDERFRESLDEFRHRLVDDVRLIGDLGDLDPDRKLADDGVHRALEVFSERDDVGTILHGNAEAERRLAVLPHEEARRILVAAFDGCDVAEPEDLSVRLDRHGGDRCDSGEGAGHPQIDAVGRGVDRAAGDDGVLPGHALEDLLRREPEHRELGVTELDEDFLRSLADDVDLVDVGDPQQPLADVLGTGFELGEAQAVGREHIHRRIDVTVVGVEIGTDSSRRQFVPDVADLFADLVPEVLHFGGRGLIAQGDADEGITRLGIALNTVEIWELLQLLLDLVDGLCLQLARGGARPTHVDNHRLDRERGVLGAAEIEVRIDAGCAQEDDREQDKRPMRDRPLRQVEPLHLITPIYWRARTFRPGSSFCTPSVTTSSPSAMPWVTSAASSANHATVTGRSVSVRDVSTTYTEGPVPRLRIAESGSFATFASTAGVSVTVAVMP